MKLRFLKFLPLLALFVTPLAFGDEGGSSTPPQPPIYTNNGGIDDMNDVIR